MVMRFFCRDAGLIFCDTTRRCSGDIWKRILASGPINQAEPDEMIWAPYKSAPWSSHTPKHRAHGADPGLVGENIS